MCTLDFSPIGIVHRDASDQEVRNRSGPQESTIEVYSMFQDGLDGLDGFSHIFVLGYFHKLRPEQIGPLKVRPRGLLKYGFKLEDLPLVGVFSLDSPTRPNPIGLSLVRLLRIEQGRNLVVTGLDYFDGTPIVDIKPYEKSYIASDYMLPDWHKKLGEKAGYV